MKKVFLVFMSLMFIMCLTGCDRKNDDSINNNISLLKNEFKEDTLITFDFSLEDTLITFDFFLEDKINEIKEGRKNQYLIKYIHKEKFYCGYIDEYISKQIEDKLWIKEDNLLYSFKKFLFNNGGIWKCLISSILF